MSTKPIPKDDDAFFDQLSRELRSRREGHECPASERLTSEIDAARLLLRDGMPWMSEEASLVQLAQAAMVFLTRRAEVRDQLDAALEEHATGD